MNLHSGEAGMYGAPMPKMPPGRDNIPADHQRRIAQIYHLSERELAHESVEVRQLCRDYRDKLWASEKQAKIERGDIAVKLRSALLRTTGSLGLIIKGARPDGVGHKDNYEHATKVLDETC